MKRFLILSVLLFTACASTQITHDTPSGKPEVTISGKVASQVKPEIINFMINDSFDMKSSTDTILIFEQLSNDLLVSAMFGSKYDALPASRVTYNIIEMADTTRVVVSFAIVTNPGSAFERITQKNNSKKTANYQVQLDKIKQSIEGLQ